MVAKEPNYTWKHLWIVSPFKVHMKGSNINSNFTWTLAHSCWNALKDRPKWAARTNNQNNYPGRQHLTSFAVGAMLEKVTGVSSISFNERKLFQLLDTKRLWSFLPGPLARKVKAWPTFSALTITFMLDSYCYLSSSCTERHLTRKCRRWRWLPLWTCHAWTCNWTHSTLKCCHWRWLPYWTCLGMSLTFDMFYFDKSWSNEMAPKNIPHILSQWTRIQLEILPFKDFASLNI